MKTENNQSFTKTKKSKEGRLIIGATLFLFGLLTFVLQYFALNQFYNLAIERTANALLPEINNLFEDIEKELLEENLDYINLGLGQLVYDDIEGLRILAMRSLEIPDVRSVYAYDSKGKLLELPTNIEKLKSRFFSLDQGKEVEKITQFEGDQLCIVFPIGEQAEVGFLELIVDAELNIIPERNAIKAKVIEQGLIVFLVGSILILFVFSIFFKRLQKSEAQLLAKTEDLKHTNQRLVMACKTAGLGAITAHLMHAIKSPLMGLKNLELGGDKSDSKLAEQALQSATKQIESMVHETINCLKEYELDEESYSFEAHELLCMTASKFEQDDGKSNCVSIISSQWDKIKINNLQANLLLPILQNLVQNALETDTRTKVFLQLEKVDSRITFLIADNGPGVPEQMKENLFSPTQSGKEHGSGLGLAICKGLAEQMNGIVFMRSSTSNGTTFCVEIQPEGDLL
ncbi:MAG: sensor histidine kinase [Opitutae bacterium]|nr:sensor histidine kinase [Opitutae bacterium]